MSCFACVSEIRIHKKFGVRSLNYMLALNISLLGGAIESGFFGVVGDTLLNNCAKLCLNSCMATHPKMALNISVLGGAMEPYLTSCWAWPIGWHSIFVWFSEIHMHNFFCGPMTNYMSARNFNAIGGAILRLGPIRIRASGSG